MPLEEYETEDSPILDQYVKGNTLTKKKITQICENLLEDAELPRKSQTYIVDLEFYASGGDTCVDYCRYQLEYDKSGTQALVNYKHTINYDGDISYMMLKVVKKPKKRIKDPYIAITESTFNDILGEHLIKIKLKDMYEKAKEKLSEIGFPHIESEYDKQGFRLTFAYYYLDKHIKTASILWNPNYSAGTDDNEHQSDEYVELLFDRPDHVRLVDVRLDYVSLYWLQQWINKVLKEKLG